MNVRLRWGSVSDAGRVRELNEDSLLVAEPVFAVADGMGGHAAGEVASQVAVATLERAFDPDHPPSTDTIVAAVRQANRDIVRQSLERSDLRGMGTTLTGLALVGAGDDAKVAVFNVGDSRTYRLRDAHLARLTIDHSYVQELVNIGEISAAQARVHPQRNIVTRALGIDQDIDVDVVEEPPITGDRYLMCSDGLVDELDDPEIERVLVGANHPQDAANELARRANASGGRDNITVIVVDVVEGRAAATPIEADARDADSGPATSEMPAIGAAGVLGADAADETATTTAAAGSPALSVDPSPIDQPLDRATGQPTNEPLGGWLSDDQSGFETGPGAVGAPVRPDEPTGPTVKTKRRRRRPSLGTIAIVLGVVIVLGAAFGAIQWYGRGNYFLGFQGDNVVVYQGRPGGVLWIHPTLEETYPLLRSQLTEAGISRVAANPTFTSRAAVDHYLDNLEGDPAAVIPPTTTTEATTTTAPPPTTVPPTTLSPTTVAHAPALAPAPTAPATSAH